MQKPQRAQSLAQIRRGGLKEMQITRFFILSQVFLNLTTLNTDYEIQNFYPSSTIPD